MVERILEVCTKELELDANALSASYEVLRKVGNLSAPTILFVIQELWAQAEDEKHLFRLWFWARTHFRRSPFQMERQMPDLSYRSTEEELLDQEESLTKKSSSEIYMSWIGSIPS